LQYKQIGRTGLKVSAMSIGTMFFGSQVSEEEAIKTLDLAFEKGINMFDTADAYVLGKSEEIVGKAIKNKRQSVVLATKIGHRGGRGPNDSGLSREHIIQGVEVSLKRLGTDYIDIYYAHTPDYCHPYRGNAAGVRFQLVRQGKVRYVACSNIRAWQLTKSLWVSDKNNLARYDCIQSVYNQLTRDVEYELLPCCAAEGVGVTVFNPLAAGFLTGKYDPNQPPPADNRFGRERTGKREQELYWSPANFKAVAELKKIAEDHGRSLVQFSLAWIINNPVISSAIVGASSAKQLEDNVKAVDIKLTDEEKKACDAVWQELRPPRVFYGS
jgi:aryl-alcohol dehydrogenase-like predicted oxidoreductase